MGTRLRQVWHAVCEGRKLEGQTAHLPRVGRGVHAAGYEHGPFQDYQYFWWVNTPDGKNHFSARGNYGQYIYVAPEKDLVIVRLGKEEGERGYGYWTALFEQLATKLDTSVKGSS